jgi:phosphoglycolate phosphatase
MIKLVAFDWNGTLLSDTFPIYEGDREVCKFLNLRVPSYKEFTEIFDIPVKNYYLKLGAKEADLMKKAQQIEDIFHGHYEKRIQKVRTRAHTKTILNLLREKQIRSMIFSNHLTDKIAEQLERLKIRHFFDEVSGNSDPTTAFKKRAKNQRLADYLKSKNIKAEETIIIGDTIEEIQIARELGAKVVAITHGNCSTKRLKEAKPDYLITSLLEIKNILKFNL